MADISTLVNDIKAVLKDDHKGVVTQEALKDFFEASGASLVRAIESPERANPRKEGVVYASELRDLEVCPRKVWYKINSKDKGEVLTPQTRLKFLYGDMTEAMLIFLAVQSGHEVAHLQEEVEISYGPGSTFRGRIDCTIDGHVVDVKSASPFAFKKMTDPSYDWDNDPFAYHRQVQFYSDHVKFKSEGYLLVFDKQGGDIALVKVPEVDVDELQNLANRARYVNLHDNATEVPKNQWVGTKPGTHGNTKLDTYCSYCSFKQACWTAQGKPIRGFAYSNGPVYLTDVKRVPDVPEFKVQ